MRAFVTGSTGLLGGNLVRLLRQQGYQVRALVRSRQKAERLLAKLEVEYVEGDMADVAGFAPALAGCDVLFHTAAYFREYFQPGDHWSTLAAINVEGTLALLRAAEQHGVKKVIYASSNTVVGMDPSTTAGDERTPPDEYAQSNLYIKSKVLAEQRIAEFLRGSALPVVLILPAWMFGPGDAAPTSSGQIVLDFLNRKLPGVLVDGGGAPVDVRDVAQAMISAVERGVSGERYIVGGDAFIGFAEIYAMLERISGVPAPRMRIPFRAAMLLATLLEGWSRLSGKPTLITRSGVRTVHRRHTTRSAKAMRELGVALRPFEETLRDEVAWFRANQPERLAAQLATAGR